MPTKSEVPDDIRERHRRQRSRLAPRPRARALLCLVAASALQASADVPGVEVLRWLAGCWAIDGGEPGSVEHWLPPAGNTMLGVSRTVTGGRTVAYEFMRIHADTDGRIVYTALPSGQSAASFAATSVEAASVTFENPRHDFPQRIVYRLVGNGRLLASIAGTRAGVARQVEFPMRAVACDAVIAPR